MVDLSDSEKLKMLDNALADLARQSYDQEIQRIGNQAIADSEAQGDGLQKAMRADGQNAVDSFLQNVARMKIAADALQAERTRIWERMPK